MSSSISIFQNVKTKETSQNTKWTFWKIFYCHGLNKSFINFLRYYPLSILYVVIEFISSSLSTYATIQVTSKLTNRDMQNETIFDIWFILLLCCLLFSSDVTKFVRKLTRLRACECKYKILRNIQKTICSEIEKASYEIRKEYGVTNRTEALNQFLWIYDTLVDSIVNTLVQLSRFILLSVYILHKGPEIFLLLIGMYYILWYYVLSKRKEKTPSSESLYHRSYYDVVIEETNKVNPLFDSLYESEHGEIYTSCFLRNPEDIKKHDYENAKKIETKVYSPNISERYMEIIKFYSFRFSKWQDSHDTMEIIQNCLEFTIIVALIWFNLYKTAMLIIVNRSSLFGIVTEYNNFTKIEHNAQRSMEKIVKLLNAIDLQSTSDAKQLIDPTVKHNDRKRISSMTINDLRIIIPPQKKNIDDENDKKSIFFDRYIVLDFVKIDVEPNKCLLLEGCTGCGKSITVNVLAGLYTNKVCENMFIVFTNGDMMNGEFNQIISSRCYISQLLSEDYKYNGKISMPMYKLFPGANNMEEVFTFLSSVFALNATSIPENLDDYPHSKLSGGEVQRYVVASQIWKANRTKPDIMILDEVDRALDKDTAMKMMEWIFKNLKCFFIVVTHLTEVKEMLSQNNHISQIWTYEEILDKHQIKIHTRILK